MSEQVSLSVVAPVLAAHALCKTVDSGGQALTILHQVSFTVLPGERVAIVGASGSGKSTLLGLLAGLDLPTQGDVELGGQKLSQLTEDGRARLRASQLGFVFQSFQLLPSLTAHENVALPLELAGRPDANGIASRWLERVGLLGRASHRPRHLSGGEQQRVALARAFATDPRLILADEPTGNLDAETGQQVIDLMFSLNAERGTTLILVTHDENLAARCGRILRMRDGHLSAEAP